jgi:uncharacterized protein YjhX (UPF0386 family)
MYAPDAVLYVISSYKRKKMKKSKKGQKIKLEEKEETNSQSNAMTQRMQMHRRRKGTQDYTLHAMREWTWKVEEEEEDKKTQIKKKKQKRSSLFLPAPDRSRSWSACNLGVFGIFLFARLRDIGNGLLSVFAALVVGRAVVHVFGLVDPGNPVC